MSDDDIPVLTSVVRRERRAHLPLTEGLRHDIAQRITTQVEALFESMIDRATDRLRGQLRDESKAILAELIEAAIEDEVKRRRENPADGVPHDPSEDHDG
ncbi:MAG: hypothetical protein AAFN07_05355 [Pseudomonadota bacterium]